MRIIDCQSHLFHREYAEFVTRHPGKISIGIENDFYLLHFNEDVHMRIRALDYSVEKKIQDMDRVGIDVSIIGSNIPGPEMLAMDLRSEGARIINNATAAACAKYPSRLVGLAVLPFSTIEETLAEYDRAINIQKMKGIQLYSHLSGFHVDDKRFEPLFERIEKDGTVIVIHPTVPEWAPSIRDHSMIPMLGYMVDHSFAMLRIILSGLLERYPLLKIIQPHCGGVLPYLMPRVDEQTEIKRRGREHIKKAPSEYYRSVYLDIVSPSAKTARFAFDYQGADKMVFGSDHPWITLKDMLEVLNQMGLTEEQKEAVLYKNAATLFGLEH
ncbi:MAG: amidohydrolase family protein [Sphaerochaetaceae bacterium]|nr:amidohydrolase [Sphaerochaetaceae bacterium]MDD3671190.1 amidohydrolase family protein [Sphaerochaetaceae bacterium]MDD4260027.1 amidohydrolase family protein [Sphaerochaetaceae bacterium]MDD4763597.1 amidohydrolase family protein [Sphaerochaetaceae bacterium]MDD4841146.1 amidohydrolase family protein [Sphaerochaetaceae bacterium]